MKCMDPILVYNDTKGGRQFRHFTLASPLFLRMHQQVFNCGKCIHCRKKRAYELASRCVLHASLYKENSFLTLTYDEKRDGYHNNFQYADIQEFKKNLRHYVTRHFDKKIEVFNVHEYGKNGKKHWHLIVFNHDFSIDAKKNRGTTTFTSGKVLHTYSGGLPLYNSKKLTELWPYGFNTVGDVSAASAMYQAQYCEKDFKNRNESSKQKAHSKHSGIGKPYFLRHYKQILQLGYIPISGRKLPLPRYFHKLAHRHYSHFYEKSNFEDTKLRRALYRPFRKEQPNLEIANLFVDYRERKDLHILDLITEWDAVISQHLTSKRDPDFIKSGSNTLYDLNNKLQPEIF